MKQAVLYAFLICLIAIVGIRVSNPVVIIRQEPRITIRKGVVTTDSTHPLFRISNSSDTELTMLSQSTRDSTCSVFYKGRIVALKKGGKRWHIIDSIGVRLFKEMMIAEKEKRYKALEDSI